MSMPVLVFNAAVAMRMGTEGWQNVAVTRLAEDWCVRHMG